LSATEGGHSSKLKKQAAERGVVERSRAAQQMSKHFLFGKTFFLTEELF